MPDLDYDIAVFSQNEAATIESCILAIDRACAQRKAHISVFLNGTTDNTLDIIKSLSPIHAALSVYWFIVADKANAINHFFYNLRKEAKLIYCVDGYAVIDQFALKAIENTFASHPTALITSGVRINGRSAKSMREMILKNGAINGNLYAMLPSFVNRLVTSQFRLPLRLYRTDPLLGSMAAHNLDAMGTTWDSNRIVGASDATYKIKPLSIFRWRDYQRQFWREIRQARGRFENEAIKTIIYSEGYAGLPKDAGDMISWWLKSHTLRPQSAKERFFMWQAMQQLNVPKPLADHLHPMLVYER
jgi:hypothetical protein